MVGLAVLASCKCTNGSKSLDEGRKGCEKVGHRLRKQDLLFRNLTTPIL
jgi:hypothetical protein